MRMNWPGTVLMLLLAGFLPAQAARAAPLDAEILGALKAKRVLVIGATGRNGGAIVAALEAAGAKPRAMVRDLARAQEKAGPGVERDWVVGDLRDPRSLDAALQGVDVVINAAATTQMQGPNGTAAVDREGMRNLVAAAKRADVGRIVLITGMIVPYPPQNLPPPMAAGLADKREAERLLQASGLEYVILRPTGIQDRPGGLWAISLADSAVYRATPDEMAMRRGPQGAAPAPDAPPPAGTIARADLAEVAVVSAVDPQARNRAFVVTQGTVRAPAPWRDQLVRMPAD
jgi:uncharacterized protein YbjT (DUF2867 family)